MAIKKWFRKKIYWFANPLRYRILKNEFKGNTFNLLDIGAGNHSAYKTKLIFPACKYFGLDKVKSYNYNENDFNLMDGFYEINLESLEFDLLQNNYFDAIVISHVLEHLKNGDLVLFNLFKKLKQGGIIYIEYPGIKSTKLPNMKGTLNFFDDKTHIRIYSLREIYNLFLSNSIIPVKGGTRRNLIRIILLPVLIPYRLITKGYLVGSDFWDMLGFAEYVIGVKKNY